MEPKAVNLHRLPSNTTELEKSFSSMNISDVFTDKIDFYINEFKLFTAMYNYIPNFVHEVGINCLKANEWFSEKYKSDITDRYFCKVYQDQAKKVELNSVFCMKT